MLKTPEDYKFFGMDAESLKDNRVLKQCFLDLKETINHKELSCDLNDAEKAKRLILMRQILAMIERQIDNYIVNGQLAVREIDRLTDSKKITALRR